VDDIGPGLGDLVEDSRGRCQLTFSAGLGLSQRIQGDNVTRVGMERLDLQSECNSCYGSKPRQSCAHLANVRVRSLTLVVRACFGAQVCQVDCIQRVSYQPQLAQTERRAKSTTQPLEGTHAAYFHVHPDGRASCQCTQRYQGIGRDLFRSSIASDPDRG
jgi:hypothetical protein